VERSDTHLCHRESDLTGIASGSTHPTFTAAMAGNFAPIFSCLRLSITSHVGTTRQKPDSRIEGMTS
jgi:hypothetical protein